MKLKSLCDILSNRNYLKYAYTLEYDVRQLARMIKRAGWTILGAYDHLYTLQNFTPKSSRIVIVARAQ